MSMGMSMSMGHEISQRMEMHELYNSCFPKLWDRIERPRINKFLQPLFESQLFQDFRHPIDAWASCVYEEERIACLMYYNGHGPKLCKVLKKEELQLMQICLLWSYDAVVLLHQKGIKIDEEQFKLVCTIAAQQHRWRPNILKPLCLLLAKGGEGK